jgi:anti-sigma factor RsiW
MRQVMNCAEWERLLDAYLDRQLAGALRLEFDAHRLACRRCQQTLSMMEACEHVIAGDKPPVALSEDFTDQLMTQIGAVPQSKRPVAPRWVFRLSAVALPAAAALLLAVYLPAWRGAPDGPAVPGPGASAEPHSAIEFAALDGADPRAPGIDEVERLDRGHALIADVIAQRLRASLAAGKSLSAETVRMAQYLNIDLPPDVARHKVDFATVNPIGGIFFEMLAPAPADAGDGESDDDAPGTRI